MARAGGRELRRAAARSAALARAGHAPGGRADGALALKRDAGSYA
jgi:hypothetical protein